MGHFERRWLAPPLSLGFAMVPMWSLAYRAGNWPFISVFKPPVIREKWIGLAFL